MDEITRSYKEMIKVHGWVGTAAMLGMSRSVLENRVYEVSNTYMHVNTAMLLQKQSGTTLFAEAVANESGGVFIPMPEAGLLDGHDLLVHFHKLYAELGELSSTYQGAINNDGEIDASERAALERIEMAMHKTMRELMGTMFKVHCRQPEAEQAGKQTNALGARRVA
ncbi:MAG: hypothetical protein K2X55_28055 [Burkholderiaceae bacterium]|nr:hypothetical protein [Burkholderiaceae bacterium]